MKSDSCKPLLLHSLPPLEKIMLATFCILHLCSNINADSEYLYSSGHSQEDRDAKFGLVLKISQLTFADMPQKVVPRQIRRKEEYFYNVSEEYFYNVGHFLESKLRQLED